MDHDEIVALAWRTTWVEAFPTLLPSLLFVESNDDILLQHLAFRSIFGSTSEDGSKNARCNTEPDTTSQSYSLNNSLGYGEITTSSVFKVMEWIWNDRCDSDSTETSLSNAIVVDLGSGNGRALASFALAHPFSRAIGYEVLPNLHNEAVRNGQLWKQWQVGLPTECELEFHCDDFTRTNASSVLALANVVYVHATVFDGSLMRKVERLVYTSCSIGTYVVMVTKPLSTIENKLETRTRLQLAMDWGQATVYIQQLV